MCLFPRIIDNPKYKGSKKNNYRPPQVEEKFAKIAIPCGCCIECRKKRAREWAIRMKEQLKETPKGYFATLTFSDKSIEKLCKETKTENALEIARVAVRRFCERWRKSYKKSVKHWLITELGHQNTKRLHLHGIIFTNESAETIKNIWGYGFCFLGEELSEKTINYIMKYVTKYDKTNPYFIPKIFCSPGIGKAYTENKTNLNYNKFNGENTNNHYIDRGRKKALPKYYANKIYSEEERQKLWGYIIDKGEKFIMGMKFDKSSINEYYRTQRECQKYSKKLGYRPIYKWQKMQYPAKI